MCILNRMLSIRAVVSRMFGEVPLKYLKYPASLIFQNTLSAFLVISFGELLYSLEQGCQTHFHCRSS